MGGLVTPSVRVHDARDLAQILLDGQTERWRHTIGVARRAEGLADTVDGFDGAAEILISAAWLHDIGYSPAVHDTGFHPLDGARYLDRHHWPTRLSALVAHHSGACFVAAERGLTAALEGVFPRGVGSLRRAHICRPDGRAARAPDDASGAGYRHARSPWAGLAQRSVHHLRWPYLLEVADRVEQRLSGRSL
jgi:HD domain